MTDPAGRPDRLGTVLRDGPSVRLVFERDYPDVPVEDVWSAVTDSERLGLWFGTWTGDPASGSVSMSMTSEEEQEPSTMLIRTCRSPELLEVSSEGPDGPWPLSVRLSTEAGGTRLTFVHQLTEPYDAGSIGPGWQFYLDRLGAVLDGTPLPTRFEDYHPRLADRYAVPET
jgi:uncharacterized protein YndB with AHSA1/START domain